VNCLSLYYYNDYFKEQLYKLKGCYDIELASTFLYPFSKELKLLFYGYYLILIPSSKSDDDKRGFNHVEEIFKCLNMPILKILSKKFNVKQSDRNFNQRKLILYDLKVNNIKWIYNKKILIVDDVCTTGNTLSAAIKLLKEGKPKKIKVLTLCKVKNLEG
jgi:competence protein ComFC